ncbi:MAG: adenylate/guanylate cyclase domain-containing protein, partial [Planctomycetota bacterium]
MARTENLTVMFTDIVGFTAKTAGLSREEHEALLVGHDRLFLPIIANYSGTRIKSLGDSMLVAFRSPTDAVKCGMALQDAVCAYDRTTGSERSFHIRVAISVGEVRVSGGDIFGEAVNVAGHL